MLGSKARTHILAAGRQAQTAHARSPLPRPSGLHPKKATHRIDCSTPDTLSTHIHTHTHTLGPNLASPSLPSLVLVSRPRFFIYSVFPSALRRLQSDTRSTHLLFSLRRSFSSTPRSFSLSTAPFVLDHRVLPLDSNNYSLPRNLLNCCPFNC